MKQIHRAGPAGMLGHLWVRVGGKGWYEGGTAPAIRRERDMLGKSTLCPLAGGSGSISMPPSLPLLPSAEERSREAAYTSQMRWRPNRDQDYVSGT